MLLIDRHLTACFEQERVAALTGLWSQSLEWGALADEATAPGPGAPEPLSEPPGPAPGDRPPSTTPSTAPFTVDLEPLP
jgi:hypothetical protein